MGIRNWVKILLASTPLPPFTTAKKTWEQASCNFLFEVYCQFKCLSMERKDAQTQSLSPQIWRLEIWLRKCFCPQPSPTPHPHLHLPRKNDKRNSNFLCCRTCSSSILTNKRKKTSKDDHLSSRYGGLKLEEKFSQCSHGRPPFCPSRKNGKSFLQIYFAMQS
jgi:hypothetical protein